MKLVVDAIKSEQNC